MLRCYKIWLSPSVCEKVCQRIAMATAHKAQPVDRGDMLAYKSKSKLENT